MRPRKILVVDDEATALDLYSRALAKAGYAVTTAATSEEALAVIEKEKPGVCFLDLQLPDMDGIELCRRIRQKDPMVVVFAITGNARLYGIQECRRAGFDDYYTKPMDMKTLLVAADQAFEKLEHWKKA